MYREPLTVCVWVGRSCTSCKAGIFITTRPSLTSHSYVIRLRDPPLIASLSTETRTPHRHSETPPVRSDPHLLPLILSSFSSSFLSFLAPLPPCPIFLSLFHLCLVNFSPFSSLSHSRPNQNIKT